MRRYQTGSSSTDNTLSTMIVLGVVVFVGYCVLSQAGLL